MISEVLGTYSQKITSHKVADHQRDHETDAVRRRDVKTEKKERENTNIYSGFCLTGPLVITASFN